MHNLPFAFTLVGSLNGKSANFGTLELMKLVNSRAILDCSVGKPQTAMSKKNKNKN